MKTNTTIVVSEHSKMRNIKYRYVNCFLVVSTIRLVITRCTLICVMTKNKKSNFELGLWEGVLPDLYLISVMQSVESWDWCGFADFACKSWTYRWSPPIALGATGGVRLSHRELQATKSVATNQNSRCDWRTPPVRTGKVH